MSAITRIGATGAGALLALGLFAAPPAGASDDHESKADQEKRSAQVTCLAGDGKTQGRSASDPDGMSNGGADKPGCEGGSDADRDGNNGCGNDADREDDNNGHCGGPRVLDRGDDPDGTDDVDGYADDKDEADTDDDVSTPTSSSTTTTTTKPVTDAPSADEDDESTDTESDDTDTSTTEPEPEAPAGDESSPVTTAGAGIGILAVLGGVARLFLRIW